MLRALQKQPPSLRVLFARGRLVSESLHIAGGFPSGFPTPAGGPGAIGMAPSEGLAFLTVAQWGKGVGEVDWIHRSPDLPAK